MGDAVELGGGKVMITNARRVKFGLVDGSSDLIGWVPITIRQDMLGKQIAAFVAVETKSARGRVQASQQNFVDRVAEAGGVSFIARSTDEAQTKFLEGICQLTSQPSTQRRSRT
jgi:hypothetical protein